MSQQVQQRSQQRHTQSERAGSVEQEEVDTKATSGECPECSGNIVTEDSEQVCSDCSIVVSETEIDRGPEWRAYTSSEETSRSRTGSPMTQMQHDKGLSTRIDWQDRDASGQSLSSKQRNKARKLRKWNKRTTRVGAERRLAEGLGEIDRMGSALGVPDQVRETASVLFKRAQSEGILYGRSIEGVTTACLYASTRLSGSPRLLDSVMGVTRHPERKQVLRDYQEVCSEFSLEIGNADPRDYIGQIYSKLGLYDTELEQQLKKHTQEILKEALENNINTGSGYAPSSLAAAACYIAGKHSPIHLTQSDISAAAGPTNVTIRNRSQDICEVTSVDYNGKSQEVAEKYYSGITASAVSTEPCEDCGSSFLTELRMKSHECGGKASI